MDNWGQCKVSVIHFSGRRQGWCQMHYNCKAAATTHNIGSVGKTDLFSPALQNLSNVVSLKPPKVVRANSAHRSGSPGHVLGQIILSFRNLKNHGSGWAGPYSSMIMYFSFENLGPWEGLPNPSVASLTRRTTREKIVGAKHLSIRGGWENFNESESFLGLKKPTTVDLPEFEDTTVKHIRR